jgi:pimeloyl-ACP methyl ester carboxylesterase
VEHVVGEECDLIALSTSAEFAAGAALQTSLIRSLVLISPTGLMQRELPGPATQQKVHRVLRKPWLGRSLFRVLTLRRVIARYINMNFADRAPDALIDYAALSAREPGARHAPFYFLSFQLFSANAVDTLYSKVCIPALVLYDQDPNLSFERLPELIAERPNWHAERISPSFGLPHWEQPERSFAAIEHFWTPA